MVPDFLKYSKKSENFDHFRQFQQGFWTSIFGKIFGKFREIFGRLKPLFYFGPVSTVENFRLSAIGNCRKSKISGKRMALAPSTKSGNAHSFIKVRGSITVLSTSCNTGLDMAIFEINKNFSLEAS